MDVLLHSSLHSLALPASELNYFTMYNEGVYIRFPSCSLKLSNRELKLYLLALTILNVVYLLKDESYPLKVHYNIQRHLFLNDFI
jgi:hypothetical protein